MIFPGKGPVLYLMDCATDRTWIVHFQSNPSVRSLCAKWKARRGWCAKPRPIRNWSILRGCGTTLRWARTLSTWACKVFWLSTGRHLLMEFTIVTWTTPSVSRPRARSTSKVSCLFVCLFVFCPSCVTIRSQAKSASVSKVKTQEKCQLA